MGRKRILTSAAEISGVIGLIVAIVLGINQWQSNPKKEKEITILVENYYDSAMRQDYEDILSFYEFPIERYFDSRNLTSEALKKKQVAYYERWKYQRINVVDNSIKVEERKDGKKKVTLKLDYQTKKNKSDKFKNFDLKIFMMLNANNKIISIYEMQN